MISQVFAAMMGTIAFHCSLECRENIISGAALSEEPDGLYMCWLPVMSAGQAPPLPPRWWSYSCPGQPQWETAVPPLFFSYQVYFPWCREREFTGPSITWVTEQLGLAVYTGYEAVKAAVAIVLGIVFVFELPQGVFRWMAKAFVKIP